MSFCDHLFCGLSEDELAIELKDELEALPAVIYG